eukprot:3450470-Pleurochrysis_carterae.AAC.1
MVEDALASKLCYSAHRPRHSFVLSIPRRSLAIPLLHTDKARCRLCCRYALPSNELFDARAAGSVAS